jgi:hypothetical protein
VDCFTRNLNFCVVLCIFMLWYVFLCWSMYFYVVVCIFVLFYLFLFSSMYFCVVLCIFILWYVFLCCSMYLLCCGMYFCVVLCIVCFVSFSVFFVRMCVLYYCHRVAAQLQLNISYIVSYKYHELLSPFLLPPYPFCVSLKSDFTRV